jgi:hypothetical protein
MSSLPFLINLKRPQIEVGIFVILRYYFNKNTKQYLIDWQKAKAILHREY